MGLVRRICNVYSSRVSPVALRCAVQLSAGQLLVALPVLISYPNFLSRVAWIATINYSAPMYLIAAVGFAFTLPFHPAALFCFVFLCLKTNTQLHTAAF